MKIKMKNAKWKMKMAKNAPFEMTVFGPFSLRILAKMAYFVANRFFALSLFIDEALPS